VPLIVKQFEPEGGADPKIIDRHGKIGEMITQYKTDLKNYYKELGEIEKSRQLKDDIFKDKELNVYSYMQDWTIAKGILDILENAEDSYKDYLYSEEDERERKLEEKYRDALRWRGPLFGVIIGKMNGYEFRVYSNDHDKHFHVIHKQKGINARFSFPDKRITESSDSGG